MGTQGAMGYRGIGTGGMEHMGNRPQWVQGVWGTGGMGHREYGPHRQGGTWARGHMGKGAHGQFGHFCL